MGRIYWTIDQWESAEPYAEPLPKRILKTVEWDDELFDEEYDLTESEQDDVDE